MFFFTHSTYSISRREFSIRLFQWIFFPHSISLTDLHIQSNTHVPTRTYSADHQNKHTYTHPCKHMHTNTCTQIRIHPHSAHIFIYIPLQRTSRHHQYKYVHPYTRTFAHTNKPPYHYSCNYALIHTYGDIHCYTT